jgi:acetone carboxylase gamma subunit
MLPRKGFFQGQRIFLVALNDGDERAIQSQLGHHSPDMIRRYILEANLFKTSSARKLRLNRPEFFRDDLRRIALPRRWFRFELSCLHCSGRSTPGFNLKPGAGD